MKPGLFITATIFSLCASLAYGQSTAPGGQPVVSAERYYSPEQWNALTQDQREQINADRRALRDAKRAEWKSQYDTATPEVKAQMLADKEAKRQAEEVAWKERYAKATSDVRLRMDAQKKARDEWIANKQAERAANAPPPEQAPGAP
jgi:hypothetical protein